MEYMSLIGEVDLKSYQSMNISRIPTNKWTRTVGWLLCVCDLNLPSHGCLFLSLLNLSGQECFSTAPPDLHYTLNHCEKDSSKLLIKFMAYGMNNRHKYILITIINFDKLGWIKWDMLKAKVLEGFLIASRL